MQITVETTLAAPLADVWRAWTSPQDIVQWNAASDDWHTPHATVDLRVGGTFCSRMEARDGSAGFDFTGVYTCVEPMQRLECEFFGRRMQVSFTEGPAGVKVREHSIHGVRRHAASAGEVFADVAAEVGDEHFCGLEFTLLQFAADRAAQLTYKEEIGPGKPVRVFPFVLQPEPQPLA